MANPVELAFEMEKTLRQALHLSPAKRDLSLSELLSEILRKELAVEIGEVSGVPPLAALIQLHHNRVLATIRAQRLSALK